jgi:hypothetical protein
LEIKIEDPESPATMEVVVAPSPIVASILPNVMSLESVLPATTQSKAFLHKK